MKRRARKLTRREREAAVVFTYRCTNCRTMNDTKSPPEDNMLHCRHCGYQTVQTCEKVSANRRLK